MTNIDIYRILSSKPHNAHYLLRYWKFIQSCAEQNKNIDPSVYTERHHICPKSSDLFPEYKSFTSHKWNIIRLTARQHFIAHWMLCKCYNGKQFYAFYLLMTLNKHKKSYKNSKLYESIRLIISDRMKLLAKGKHTYVDIFGNKIFCSNSHPDVLNGNLVSVGKGRKMSQAAIDNWKVSAASRPKIKRTEEQNRNHSIKMTGRKSSDVTKKKISDAGKLRKGKDSPETRLKKSEHAKSQRAAEIPIKCPHCPVTSTGPNMVRYHFYNCKHQIILSDL